MYEEEKLIILGYDQQSDLAVVCSIARVRTAPHRRGQETINEAEPDREQIPR